MKVEKSKIIVIDDDALTANVIAQLLDGFGAQITQTTDSASAYEKILETQPDQRSIKSWRHVLPFIDNMEFIALVLDDF